NLKGFVIKALTLMTLCWNFLKICSSTNRLFDSHETSSSPTVINSASIPNSLHIESIRIILLIDSAPTPKLPEDTLCHKKPIFNLFIYLPKNFLMFEYLSFNHHSEASILACLLASNRYFKIFAGTPATTA